MNGKKQSGSSFRTVSFEGSEVTALLSHSPSPSHRLIAPMSSREELTLPVPASQPNITAHLELLGRVERRLETNLKDGLSRTVALQRQSQQGRNTITLPSASTFRVFRGWLPREAGLLASKYVEQFMNPLIGLLLASALVSLLLRQMENAASIGVAVAIVGTVGFIQEYRTEKSLEALQRLAPPRCRVVRDGGRVWDVLAAELVVGDVVELVLGDRVPADLLLITCSDLQIDESLLTGETKPARKQPLSAANHHGDADEPNESRAWMGTLVRQGRARGLVRGTGIRTEFGRLAAMMHDTTERKSPLQLRLDHLGHQLTVYSAGVIALISLAGVLIQHRALMDVFTVAVSLAVAAIPEGLPIVATITLALGVLRLARHGVVVKKLPAVEALGSMTVLCADKTGTLTSNEVTVQAVYSVATDMLHSPVNPNCKLRG